MLYTIIKKNFYQDSVNLMILSSQISSLEGIKKVSILMGSTSNKQILTNSNLYTESLDEAGPNDICIVIDTDIKEMIEVVKEDIESFFKNFSIQSSENNLETVSTWESALSKISKPNLAVISVPGAYAFEVAQKALDENLHVFIFSDNVPKEEELRLKYNANEKGLLCMGPDCGTSIIKSIPIAFANNVSPGNIGIVGASGTGIQEVSTIVDKLGGGVTNAIGVGGRDLSEEVKGITLLDAVATLAADKNTKVITIVSKPPAEEVKTKIMNFLRSIEKPIVTVFLGEKPTYHEENLYHAYTLEEAARISVSLSKNEEPLAFNKDTKEIIHVNEKLNIKGYYSGGTLAEEASMLIKDSLGILNQDQFESGYKLNKDGFEIIDLGDDKYTQGKPHPMIDPSLRKEYISNAVLDESTGVILFDIVLGYGAHNDMAGALAPTIEEVKQTFDDKGKSISFVATLCGTDKDPQNYDEQKKILEDIGVFVYDTNNQAVEKALALIGKQITYEEKIIQKRTKTQNNKKINVSNNMRDLITTSPRIINIGLKSFAETMRNFDIEVIHYDWKPVAGGNQYLASLLSKLK